MAKEAASDGSWERIKTSLFGRMLSAASSLSGGDDVGQWTAQEIKAHPDKVFSLLCTGSIDRDVGKDEFVAALAKCEDPKLLQWVGVQSHVQEIRGIKTRAQELREKKMKSYLLRAVLVAFVAAVATVVGMYTPLPRNTRLSWPFSIALR